MRDSASTKAAITKEPLAVAVAEAIPKMLHGVLRPGKLRQTFDDDAI